MTQRQGQEGFEKILKKTGGSKASAAGFYQPASPCQNCLRNFYSSTASIFCGALNYCLAKNRCACTGICGGTAALCQKSTPPVVKSADFCVAGSKVRFMSPRLWYDDKKILVNCKSEGNVLGIENEEKGDAHFCK